MTPSPPHLERCDIEDQCQHFCVYKQMTCPVYIRHSTTTSEQQEWQNASLRDSEKFICQSERDKVLDIQKKILEDMNLMKFTARREGFDSVTLYDAQNIVKQRIGEFIRGEK